MNSEEYFKDLSKEFRAVQNRIRNLIGPVHWPSDGAWKESVLRSVLRRYLPPSFTVGSGFIVMADGVSTQIDILVCDDSAPMLFREGDFMIATPECVRAAVEVKTGLRSAAKLREALEKLNEISSLLRRRPARPRPFLGLFSYEPMDTEAKDVLDLLHEVNGGTNYEIQALCFGDSQYYRFWELDPRSHSTRLYESWHAYNLKEIAPGYFVHNLVEFLFPNAVDHGWYPADGKERHLLESKIRRNMPETKM